MSDPIRIAVLMGGASSEHDVSLASAAAVIDALDPGRYAVTAVRISREGVWSVDERPVTIARSGAGTPALVFLDGGAPSRGLDVVFPVLHGPNGEDGTVQGLLECAGVAYVGAGVAASAVAMDKALFKDVLRANGIPTPDWVVVSDSRWRDDPAGVRARVAAAVAYPAFVKPARLGSSVGISRVAGPEDLDAAIELALRHDPKVLVERGISGREIEVGVLGEADPVASPVGEIGYDGDWYDYETKYQPGRMRLDVPAAIPAEIADRARGLALRAFEVAECRGLARVDFFLADDGEVLLSELNTMPGFTPTSVYAALMGAGGIEYRDLIDRLVALGIARHERARAYLG
ncbi:MAG: D-alanine--D-alanine ligase family protein [Thermoleophilia bacterium]|jgi:D-alanine-D-alanine ligase